MTVPFTLAVSPLAVWAALDAGAALLWAGFVVLILIAHCIEDTP